MIVKGLEAYKGARGRLERQVANLKYITYFFNFRRQSPQTDAILIQVQ